MGTEPGLTYTSAGDLVQIVSGFRTYETAGSPS